MRGLQHERKGVDRKGAGEHEGVRKPLRASGLPGIAEGVFWSLDFHDGDYTTRGGVTCAR